MNTPQRPRWIVPDMITQAITAAKQQRFGDAVHAIAHPVAVAVDKVLQTNLANCGGCAQRREQWNMQADSDKAAKEA